MKNIHLLGATGSIGTQVLEVIKSLDGFSVKSISFGKNIPKGKEIIENFNPEFVCVLEKEDAENLQKHYPHIKFSYGEKGLVEAATYGDESGVLVNAVVGMVGLKPTIAAINKGRNILLANKETLVVGGEIINRLVKEKNVKLIPIDSEHSAIMQCLDGRSKEDISKIIITASGGSFRDKSRKELENVTVENALAHPNWNMGAKITIDSATMVNKGLEVIEAHYLFDIPYDKIETIIHYESIIHSLVEFKDRSVIAQLGVPDMRIPIQYALTYPNTMENNISKSLDFNIMNKLTFKKMDFDRFPCLRYAYEAGIQGGVMPTVYNTSNEEAVRLFLEKKISFLDIEKIIFEMMGRIENISNPTLDDIFQISKLVKDIISAERK
ncbi:MAG TPA: 1-deoxy-D-xylulose-5-phosphate reductoisomerase [Acholeplasmataceae bacterium]|jgi:1-deoxy-D-xylulose-5-phosphate reductoisomerase|nr:1-deoxy-D-xylulose-5-phosphate reductoisomerase [Acholeplasmataceae bacterium]